MSWHDRKIKDAAFSAFAEIQEKCRPILVGFGGSISYGTSLPSSDVDIRGIYLNPAEEWIGLREDSEQLSIEGSDTMIFSLKKAMRLFLACNPNMIELLGLKKEHILFCTAEGQKILDNAGIFLSQKAIFTYNGFAVRERKEIQNLVSGGSSDAKKICKDMMHLIRIYATGIELLETGRIVTCREREHELLMEIRGGKYYDRRRRCPTDAYEKLLEEYIGAFNAASIRTCLPKEPDWEGANQLTMDIVRSLL